MAKVPKAIQLQSLCAEAVANVLAGRTGDGAAKLSLRVPFTKDRATQAAVQAVFSAVVEQAGGTIKEEHLTALTVKLLAYFTKRGLQTPAAVAGFDSAGFADALKEAPDALLSNASVAALLRAHAQRARKDAAILREAAQDTVSARPVVCRLDSVTLVEALDKPVGADVGGKVAHGFLGIDFADVVVA